MNSSFSTLQGSLHEMLSEILDLADQLRTASMEYTLMRESGRVVGCTITFQCLLAEQKSATPPPKQISDVERPAHKALGLE